MQSTRNPKSSNELCEFSEIQDLVNSISNHFQASTRSSHRQQICERKILTNFRTAYISVFKSTSIGLYIATEIAHSHLCGDEEFDAREQIEVMRPLVVRMLQKLNITQHLTGH